MVLLRTQTARNAVLVTGTQFLSAVLRFSATILMAKVLSPHEWGNVAVVIAMVDVFAIIGDGGVNATLVRFIAADVNSRARAIFARCVFLKVTVIAVLLVCLWILREAILKNQQFPSELYWLYPVAMAAAAFVSLHGLLLSVFQSREQYGRYSLAYLSVNTFRVLVLLVLVLSSSAALPSVTLSFFAVPAVVLMLTAPLASHTLLRTTGTSGPAPEIRSLLAFMLPLAGMNAVIIANMRTSNFMLKALASSEAVANYELAYQLGFVFPLLSGALFTILLPKVSAMQSSEALRTYRGRLLRVYPAVLVLSLFGVLVGPWFITLVFGAKYADSLMIVRILVVAFGIQILTHPLSLVFYSVSRPGYLTLIHLLQFGLLVALNSFFIPRWEGTGAALAMLVSAMVTVCIVIVVSDRVLRVPQRVAA